MSRLMARHRFATQPPPTVREGPRRRGSGVRPKALRAPPWLGRFTLQRLIAAGPSADLYLATDGWTGEAVALKHVRSGEAGTIARLRHEARVLASLDHPRLPRYVAFGMCADGGAFVAMEWLGARTLADRLQPGPLDADATRTLASQLLDALAALHQRGITHRDLKPDNILCVDDDRDVRVIDFGTASDATHRITPEGMVLGTPAYMAPEQARGHGSVDARADLYALGVILYECTAGDLPWGRATPLWDVLRRKLEEPAPRLPSHLGDAGLRDGIELLLSPDASRRPRNVTEVRRALYITSDR